MLRDSQTSCDDFDSVFEGFMDGMFAWEVKYFDRKVANFYNDSEPDLEDEIREELVSLFTEYVIKGGRNYDRVDNLVCGAPPDYDRGGDDIDISRVHSDKSSVLIKKRKGLETTYRLTFVKRHGKFMLSKREFESMDGWCRTYV